jgi:hypothetical protein
MGTKEQRAFDEIMDHFDFEKCATAMRALNWCWHNEPESPTVPDLRELAREHFARPQESQTCRSTYSGGLKLSRDQTDGRNVLVLEFVLADWESDVSAV